MVNEVDVVSISSLGSIYRKEEIVVILPFVHNFVALGSSMLSPDHYADNVSALEEQIKELENDISLNLAEAEVVTYDFEEAQNSLKRRDVKVQSHISRITSLETEHSDLLMKSLALIYESFFGFQ